MNTLPTTFSPGQLSSQQKRAIATIAGFSTAALIGSQMSKASHKVIETVTGVVVAILSTLQFLCPIHSIHFKFLGFKPLKEYKKISFRANHLVNAILDGSLPASKSQLDMLDGKVKELAKKMGIKRDIQIFIKEGSFSGVAQGLSGLPYLSNPVIALGSNCLSEYSEKELDFLICHELSHIKNYDVLKVFPTYLTMVLVNFFAISLLGTYCGIYGAAAHLIQIAGMVLSIFLTSIISRRFEKQADLNACATCGPEGGLEFFKAIQKKQVEKRKQILEDPNRGAFVKFLTRLQISEEGNSKLDFLHPSLSTRIQYLEKQKKNLRKTAPLKPRVAI